MARVVVGVLVGGLVVVPGPRSAAAGYAPDVYCQFHVMGSLYGDGTGNGPANGASWNASNTTWKLSNTNKNVIDRFERCARWVVDNNVGGNGSAIVSRQNNSVSLQGFWPAGQLVPFPHDAMTSLVTEGTPLEKRAFLIGIIEGEGEVCDPANGSCATAQIADNSRSTSGGTNPNFYKHIVPLVQPAIDAGLLTAFTATAQGCVAKSEAQLSAASGAALCIRSSDFEVMKTWPVASCKRVPGYGHVAGYVCGLPDEPSGQPPPTPGVAVSVSPPTIGPGQTSTLTWDVVGASDCTASGAWSGPIGASGSMSVSAPSPGAYTYTLICSTPAGSEAASATLTVTGSAPAIQSFGAAPNPIPVGGPGTLSWTSIGMDTDSCKLRTGGVVLASRLPTGMSGWPIPRSHIREGTAFTLICFSGGTKFSATVTITVR